MPPTLTVKADTLTLRLSDTVTVRVTVEGDAPLRIDVPKELLAGESAGAWSAVAVGGAKTHPLPDGREQWVQQFKCSPYVPDSALPLEFAPFRVQAGTAIESVAVSAKVPLTFKVETSLVGAKAEDVRPVTAVEELPPPSTSDIGTTALFAILFAVLLIASATVVALVRRRRWQVRRLPPVAEALFELDRLDAADRPMDRIADIVRTFIRRQFRVTTESATTAEVLANAESARVWNAEQMAALETILSECDRAKFGTDPPDPATVAEVRELAREWVAEFSEPEA